MSMALKLSKKETTPKMMVKKCAN